MATVTVNDQSLYAIAEAIRGKLDVETTYLPSQMAAAIESIGGTDLTSADEGKVVVESEGSYVLATQNSRTVTRNGTYDTTTNDEVIVSVSGGSGGSLYTNGTAYPSSQQITDVSGFTKVYADINYGNRGAKVETALGITDESSLSTSMDAGWNGTGSCFYDAENQKGACAGYEFGEPLRIAKAKFWLGRYSSQNKTLFITVQYLDGNGDWNDAKTLEVTATLPYPTNVFTVAFNTATEIYGVRWIHKDDPYKSSGNNIVFFGMTVYEASGTPIDVYSPSSTGIIEPPEGYDGFGPLYIQ